MLGDTPSPWNQDYEERFAELLEEGHLLESGIVWLEHYPYFREAIIVAGTRVHGPGKPPYSEKRVVGYSVVDERAVPAPSGLMLWSGHRTTRRAYYRRVWYLMPWDPYEPWNPKLGGPMEAVDPATVRPNHPSLRPGCDLREPSTIGQRKADVEAMRDGTYGVWGSMRRTTQTTGGR